MEYLNLQVMWKQKTAFYKEEKKRFGLALQNVESGTLECWNGIMIKIPTLWKREIKESIWNCGQINLFTDTQFVLFCVREPELVKQSKVEEDNEEHYIHFIGIRFKGNYFKCLICKEKHFKGMLTQWEGDWNSYLYGSSYHHYSTNSEHKIMYLRLSNGYCVWREGQNVTFAAIVRGRFWLKTRNYQWIFLYKRHHQP